MEAGGVRFGWRPRLATPSPDVSWRAAEFCVIDLETTGLDLRRDEIVSYGVAIVKHARIHCGTVAYGHILPDREISVTSLTMHGLRASDLAGAPPINDVLDDLIGLLTGRVVVAHAAWIERAFLGRALARRGLRLGRPIVDTAALTRACGLADANSGREPDVETVARGLGLPVHTPHHALGDAFTTAEIFLVLATRLEREPNVVGRSQLSVRRLCALSRRHSRV
jgi:DNA polymerase-3 subunit epsilon